MTLTAVIYSLSSAASKSQELSTFVPEAVGLLAEAGCREVQLTLADRVSGEVAQSTHRDSNSGVAGFVVAHDLIVRGVRYGRLELRFDEASSNKLAFADIVASQLARFAELTSDRTRKQQVAEFVQRSAAELAARKLLARATGLFAARKLAPSARRHAA